MPYQQKGEEMHQELSIRRHYPHLEKVTDSPLLHCIKHTMSSSLVVSYQQCFISSHDSKPKLNLARSVSVSRELPFLGMSI